jgi:hypothetical protein
MERVLDFCQMDPLRGTYNFRLLELTKNEPKPKLKPKIITPINITDVSNNQVAPEDDPYLFNSVSMENMDEESQGAGNSRFQSDRVIKSKYCHSLALMSQSGEKTLLEHATTRKLLELKWRALPRAIYYFNLFMNLCFLVLYTRNSAVVNERIYRSEFVAYTWILVVLLIVLLLHELALFIYTTVEAKFPVYFRDWSNILQLLTYAGCFCAIFIPNAQINAKTVFYSTTLLVIYILFALRLDKVPVVGPYVEVFKRVFAHLTSFLPFFIIIFLGFLFTFQSRSQYFRANNVNGTTVNQMMLYSSSFPVNFVRMFYMSTGDFDQTEMGLGGDVSAQNFINYFLLLLFMFFMTLFLYNFFLGITLVELSKMLDDADLRLAKAKIRYTLAVEDFLTSVRLAKFFVLNEYDPEKYHWKLIQKVQKARTFLTKLFFHGQEDKVLLVDKLKSSSESTPKKGFFRRTSLKNELYLIKNSLQSNENVNDVVEQKKIRKSYRDKMKQ